MAESRVVIEGFADLNALHRALVEAKFNHGPQDQLVSGSPLVAKIANRVVEALEAAANEERPDSPLRDSWRWLENRPDILAVVRERLAEAEQAFSLSRQQKRELLEALIAPFLASDETLDSLADDHAAV